MLLHRPHPCIVLRALVAQLTLVTVAFVGMPAVGSAAAPEPASGSTIIVLDASGSMRGRIEGELKMNIAKRAVRELVEGLPEDTRLGLVVYSHRKASDCSDIELMIPPARLDKAAFIKAVDGIQPRGMTPLSAAVQFAAEALSYTTHKANIILVSDGLETCGKDPCATARELKRRAADLTIHAVAFDLSAKEARTFACLATETGGRLLQANNAASLKDALHVAVIESTAAPAVVPPAEILTPAAVHAPAEVPAGAGFEVTWSGPNNPGDFITIVPHGAPESSSENVAYTRQGSPLSLTALIDPGSAEVRYVAGRSHKVLAKVAINIVAVRASLSAPDEAVAGTPVTITWEGPGNRGDYITIVAQAAADSSGAPYANTEAGSPLKVAAPIAAGPGEIRYVGGNGRRILARRPINIIAAEVTLAAPAEAIEGSVVTVDWTGPGNRGDLIVIVAKGARSTSGAPYSPTEGGSPVRINAPMTPGECEIRYISGQGGRTLGERPISIVAAEVTLEAAEEAIAGAPVSVVWTGPNNRGDMLTIVPKSARAGQSGRYANASNGSPATVVAPIEPGECEIRYVSGTGGKILASRSLRIVAAEITLAPPDRAAAGTTVSIEWIGPDHRGDFITIVPKGSPDGASGRYWNTSGGSPAKVAAPAAPGPYEVRYINGGFNKVLARHDLEVVPPEPQP